MKYLNLIVENGTPKSVEHSGSQFAVKFQPPVAGISFKSSLNDDLECNVMHVAFEKSLETQVDTLLSKEGKVSGVVKDPKTGVYKSITAKRYPLVPKVREEFTEGNVTYVVKMYGVANSFAEPVLS